MADEAASVGARPGRREARLARALGVLQVFIGVGAVAGGGTLIWDPTGGALGLPASLLQDTPFSDYLVPGVALLAVNGIGSLAGAWASFGRRSVAGALALGLGLFLMAWIAAQVWWIGFGWQHLFYFVLGAVEAGLGAAWAGRARSRRA